MAVYLLDDDLWFPPVEGAEDDGLLAAGGDLSVERLLLAYRNGIFPWFSEDDDLPLWWSPDPRFVLFPEALRVSKSMKQIIRNGSLDYRMNTDFEQVIHNCSSITRKDMDGTWITSEIQSAYIQLHQLGYALSAETWRDGQLVGGLYGVRLGNVFFGESMFSRESNASKFAFIHCVQQLHAEGVQLIDCQMHTAHLESLGGMMIRRHTFIDILNKEIT